MFYCESPSDSDVDDSVSEPETHDAPDYTIIDKDASIWGKNSRETERIFQQANFVPSHGDILLFGDYIDGTCEKVIKDEETEEPQETAPRSLSNFGFVNNVPKVLKEADYLNISDEWQDRFVYSEGPNTSVKEQRTNFSAYLRESGIISIIADFIVTVEEMPNTDRPQPEDLIEHFLTHAGYTKHLEAKQIEAEMKEAKMSEKSKLLDKINALVLEGNYLKATLEEYEFLSPPYESLNPDAYTHLNLEEPYGNFQTRFWKESKITGFSETDNPLNALKKPKDDEGKEKEKKSKSKDKKDKSKDKKDKSKDKKDKSKDKKDKSKDKKDKSKDKKEKKSKDKKSKEKK